MAPRTRKARSYPYDAGARVLTVAFSLLLAIPAMVSWFTDHAARSRWENRPLVELPAPFAARKDTRFFDELDQYLNDHFGFALELNRLHRKLLFYVFRDSPSPDVSLGKDGYVFVTSFKSEPFSVLETLCVHGMDAQVAAVSADAWAQILQHFARTHEHVALLIVPSKPTLYPEKFTLAVPRRYRERCAQYEQENSVSEAIVRSAQEGGSIAIYPYKEFLQQKYNGNFYPRENFHYAGKSAHWLGREALNRLGIAVNADYEENVLGATVTHDIMNLLGFTRALEFTAYPYTAFQLRRQPRTPEYIRDYFERAQQFGVITSDNPLSQRTALVIGNSFTTFTADHLAPGYRSLIYIMTNDLRQEEYVRFFTELVPRIGADDLIFVYNDNGAQFVSQMWLSELGRVDVLH
jgi:hypothetical protein